MMGTRKHVYIVIELVLCHLTDLKTTITFDAEKYRKQAFLVFLRKISDRRGFGVIRTSFMQSDSISGASQVA